MQALYFFRLLFFGKSNNILEIKSDLNYACIQIKIS